MPIRLDYYYKRKYSLGVIFGHGLMDALIISDLSGEKLRGDLRGIGCDNALSLISSTFPLQRFLRQRHFLITFLW